MKKNIYQHLNRFILRFPTYPLDRFFSYITDGEDLLQLFQNDELFRNAVLNASPDLYSQAKSVESTDKNSEKIKLSLYKYFSRMCSRSTPFGLFAGVTVGRMAAYTNFIINDTSIEFAFKYNNLFLYNQLHKDLKLSTEDVKLYSNNTLTKLNGMYRYLEDRINEVSGEKSFSLVKVDTGPVLKKICKKAKYGIFKSILINDLIAQGYSVKDSNSYISELIDNKFLLSEVELDLHTSYLEKFGVCFEKSPKEIQSTDVYSELKKISFMEPLKTEFIYQSINSVLEGYGILSKINPVNYSATILNNDITLDSDIICKIQNIIPFLFKVSNFATNENISNFRKKFHAKYEFQKVPLLEVLDRETGLDYPLSTTFPIKNKYIENLKGYHSFQASKESNTFFLSETLKTINSKIVDAAANNRQVIKLDDGDFPDKVLDYEKFPKTVYGIAKFFVENGCQKIFINGIGGPSALNLMSRFTNLSSQICSLVTEIFEAEKLITKRKFSDASSKIILAEVSFVPDLNVSNVLGHAHIFDYYIPILGVPQENSKSIPIDLSDLYLYLDADGQLVLWSKKLNSEVQPILTNSHNYLRSDLNIYKLLSGLKGQSEVGYIGFSIGSLGEMYKHVPRFEYDNIVLFEERWFLEKEDFKSLKNCKQVDELHKEVLNFRNLYNIPQNIILVQGDNELLVDFRDEFSIRSFVKEANRSSRVELKEFLCTESLLKNEKNENFCHEIVIPFLKNI